MDESRRALKLLDYYYGASELRRWVDLRTLAKTVRWRGQFNSLAGGQMNLTRLIEIALVKLAKETRGQDLVEYGLMAGFVAVAAGAVTHV